MMTIGGGGVGDAAEHREGESGEDSVHALQDFKDKREDSKYRLSRFGLAVRR